MKKLIGFIAAFMILFSSLAFAAGGQECGDKSVGPEGDTGGGDVTQTQTPNPAD